MALASLILGIVSIICVPLGFLFGWPAIVALAVGVVGIVFGAIKRKKNKFAVAGFICSLVGTGLSLIPLFYFLFVLHVIIAILK